MTLPGFSSNREMVLGALAATAIAAACGDGKGSGPPDEVA